jgi:hypothetical protein
MVANYPWARLLYGIVIYILLLEDVTYASNVFWTYIIIIIWKLFWFSIISFETHNCTIICELNCNIISIATPCMW